MQIKRFEARDMTAALRLIKSELGPDAVILSARSLKKENTLWGSVKSVGVEVTAAIDSYHFSRPSNSFSYPVELPVEGRRERLGRSRKKMFIQSVQNRIKSFAPRQQPLNSGNGRHAENDDTHTGIFQHFLSQGVNRDIANELIEAIKKQLQSVRFDSKDKIIAMVADIIEQKRNAVHSHFRAKAHPKVLALIGPTGVGKTTTVAKLAARQAIEQKKKVALISLDSFRIVAAEELKVYGRAIGIPVKAVASPAAFRAAVNKYQHYDLILVDTPGLSPNKLGAIEDLKLCLETVRSIDTHLLLSAGAKDTDLFNIIERLKDVAIHHLIFTKLDESRTFGNLINLLVRQHLPISFLMTGRQVPDDMETGSLEKIVEYLLGGYINRPEAAKSGKHLQTRLGSSNGREDYGYVANKNSDVFHWPDCKWTLKIKAKNMITFSSVQAAEARNFVPCRDCQPIQSDTVQARFPRRDNLRVSNYL